MSEEKDIIIRKCNSMSTIFSENYLDFYEFEKNRIDAYGNIISKGDEKKQKISFADRLSLNDNKLVEIIPVESYKKFNILHIEDGIVCYVNENEDKDKEDENIEEEEEEDDIINEKDDGNSGKSCFIF